MLTVYHSGPTRSRRVLWTLEELGEPYTGVPVRFPPRLAQPEYLEINPTGAVPTMIDADVRLTESMAICEYLAARRASEIRMTPSDPGYPNYLQFMSYGEAMLTQPLGLMVRYGLLEPARNLQAVAEDGKATFQLRLEPVRQALADREYAAGDRFTLADISLMYPLHLTERLGVADLLPAEVADYVKRLSSRPAFQRAYAVE
jgi:glutathione S-transferase